MFSPDPSAPAVIGGGHTPLLEHPVEEVAQSLHLAEPPPLVEEVSYLPGAEPTAAEVVEELIAAIPSVPAPVPSVPLPVLRRAVRGRYAGTAGVWRLELRIDVDGVRPMRRVSGDYFRTQGATTTYFGSWVVNLIAVTVTPTLVTVTGTATTTWTTTFNRVRVTIPRVSVFSPPTAATVRWFNAAGQAGATYVCPFVSPFFRSVDLEQDCETGINPFASYNTGALPSGGPGRTLSVLAAYQEAGIDMRTAGMPDVVPVPPGGSWSNAELHNAMLNHFSLWRDLPQWKVWLLHARLHEMGPGLLGIMFDQEGRQRQGCAVFYEGLGGVTQEALRNQLFTCVHELGHCFNLFHSFHKQYMTPPMPNRLLSFSWMNYPWRYPTGEAAFWTGFPFQFDDLETIHLRHGFLDNVIIGGNPFGTGAALDRDDFAPPVEDNTGLRLELRARPSYRLGEPVVVELKLGLDGAKYRSVQRHLHPDAGGVRLAIRKPGGLVVVYEPVIELCLQPETTRLDASKPAIYDSAYIGYGKQGLTFDAPGIYQLRAAYVAEDGSVLVSETLDIRIRPPRSEADEDVAELLMGAEQGTLFTLLGSDSVHLASGKAQLEEAVAKYPTHPLSMYARLVLGYNAARPFGNLKADGTITVRKANKREAEKQLNAVIAESTTPGEGLDNITLGQVYCRLAKTQKAAGDEKAATDTVSQLVSLFEAKALSGNVLDTIKVQGAAALS
jgi:hypothetical protein